MFACHEHLHINTSSKGELEPRVCEFPEIPSHSCPTKMRHDFQGLAFPYVDVLQQDGQIGGVIQYPFPIFL